MAPIPTIQRPIGGAGGSSNRPTSSKRPRHGEQDKKSELVCRVRYCNNLPDLPFDPKFIQHPFESNRFIQYAPTSLERNYKYELLTEQDLGVSVDLILPETYEKTEQQIYNEYDQLELDPKDERLLEEEVSDKTDKKRSYQHSLMLSWMRKPDYISTEQTRYQPITNDMIESKIGFNVRKKMGAESNLMMDRDTQLAAIEKTFEDAKTPIEEHYSKKGVYPVEICDVLPDDKMWKYQWAQVIFDTDPAPTTEASGQAAQNEMMSQAMIRGVMDESGEQFVAYFLPTKDTMEKRAEDFAQERDYDEEGEYNYKMFREYNWNVKSKATEGFVENFFFISREDGVFYNELETRVRLSKRRLKAGQQPSNSKLIVRHRPLVRKEQRDQRKRERLIEPPNDEEEEEESSSEEEPEEEPIKDTKGDEDERRSRSRSKSRSRSRSKSRSRSASSRSRSRSVSRSRSRSVSRSRSRSVSKSPARSAKSAGSVRSRSGSRSKSRSRSRSVSRSRSKSRSRSRSKSGSRSRSASPAARSAKSGSRSRSRSRSKSRSRSRSASRSRSRSRSRSASGSRSSGSRSRSRSGSPMSARSGSGSD